MEPENNPLVTVVIPSYNHGDMLPATLKSIVDQEYLNLEILIIDDGSVDRTGEIVRPFLDADRRIRYFRHENMGEPGTVNRGWQMARGEFVVIISADDPQTPALIKRSVQAMREHPEAIVTYPDQVVIDGNGKELYKIDKPDFELTLLIERNMCLPGAGSLIRREPVIKRFPHLRNPKHPKVSDYESWLRLALIGPFFHIREPLAMWREHGNSSTVNFGVSRINIAKYRMMSDFFRSSAMPVSIKTRRRPALALAALQAAQSLLETKSGLFFPYLLRAFLLSPLKALRWTLGTVRKVIFEGRK